MNGINRLLKKLDSYQRRHTLLGFLFAVQKKYSDDQAGNQAALITYYSFVSLFPLLLVFFSILGIVIRHKPSLENHIVTAVLHYFPVAGQQLESNIHGLHHSGLGLVVELLIILYGARGVAGILQSSCNRIWGIPLKQRPGFPNSMVRSMALIVLGGSGFILTTVGLSYATSVAKGQVLPRVLLVIATLCLNFLVFLLVFRIATATKIKTSSLILGAAVAAIFWQILQAFGSFLVLHEFRATSAVYGVFALVLGILFWFYLQAELTLYALEINVVRVRKLWPRSLFDQPSPKIDKEVSKI